MLLVISYPNQPTFLQCTYYKKTLFLLGLISLFLNKFNILLEILSFSNCPKFCRNRITTKPFSNNKSHLSISLSNILCNIYICGRKNSSKHFKILYIYVITKIKTLRDEISQHVTESRVTMEEHAYAA